MDTPAEPMAGSPLESAHPPSHTNRLIGATSPYLLQHAHNPVDWYPWGSEAFEKAIREDKPIFLSIGYAACHWCHVMERESFEDEKIAEILNRHFVAVKVDREERPDLDDIYMNATVLYNRGQGGWPMSVFLTPDKKPFFAGTYFPPDNRYGRPGFVQVLQTVARFWKEDRPRVRSSADALADAVARFSALSAGGGELPSDILTQTADQLARVFDPVTGGIASEANKFPPSMAMGIMLREYHRALESGRPRREWLDLVELTLHHMGHGGIYDHLGGGIARYSTDPYWLVPHFEKMLYDQALVSGIYLEAFQVTRKAWYAQLAADLLDYVLTDLRSPEGGFYSSRDADSEGDEGRYYVWTKPEVMAVLGNQAGELFCDFYDVTDQGNWEGRSILNVQHSEETVARLHGLEVETLKNILADARARLLAARGRRVPPALDDKILTSWNGLMIASLARGGRILGERRYTAAAAQAADFILTSMGENGRLMRTCRKGTTHTGGYLDDYAFFIEGLLELYESTFEKRWLEETVRLVDLMIDHFWDDTDGAFFYTADDAERLIVRSKDSRDHAIPSGNSVALMNLLRLAALLDRRDLRVRADRTIRAFAGAVAESPLSFTRFLAGVAAAGSAPSEVAIVGSPDQMETRSLIHAVHEVYDPWRIVALLDPEDPDAAAWQNRIPLLQGKTRIQGRGAVYVCRNHTCRRPATDVETLRNELQIGARSPDAAG
ncbi:MAG TPA: thioredoxin domain-containing protein [Phycisphaerae bacterium]|nr:thioredoxin domain-containing protein [Phycisphaerae bacterium]HRY70290.1 thioredoxin domain-containing protein [Phycisphaerae bacterium]HSA27539.1 thioredoxin domain-containing protein [Phycisphaerae bacterium]